MNKNILKKPRMKVSNRLMCLKDDEYGKANIRDVSKANSIRKNNVTKGGS
jgi:hypothetical protein